MSRELKKIRWIHFIKAADKYSPGISDFLIWGQGKGVFIENKFVKIRPSPNSKLLTHPFSSKQVSFLRGMTIVSGCPAWGVIYIASEKTLHCVPSWLLPFEGNWKTKDFFAEHTFPVTDIEKMIQTIFSEENKCLYQQLQEKI